MLPILGSVLLINIASAEPIQLSEARDQFKLLHPENWKTGVVEGKESLILNVPGKQRPPVRRPGEFALWTAREGLRNPVISVTACSLEPASKINRDVCIIFGYQDDTHFYYAHISSNSDGRYHTAIMRVDGDSRMRINLEEQPKAPLKDGWNTIKLQHLETGAIQVWVNDLETPVMTADDTTYPSGSVGFGAFDDRAAFSTFSIERQG
jgi:hypothetical protein